MTFIDKKTFQLLDNFSLLNREDSPKQKFDSYVPRLPSLKGDGRTTLYGIPTVLFPLFVGIRFESPG